MSTRPTSPSHDPAELSFETKQFELSAVNYGEPSQRRFYVTVHKRSPPESQRLTPGSASVTTRARDPIELAARLAPPYVIAKAGRWVHDERAEGNDLQFSNEGKLYEWSAPSRSQEWRAGCTVSRSTLTGTVNADGHFGEDLYLDSHKETVELFKRTA